MSGSANGFGKKRKMTISGEDYSEILAQTTARTRTQT
jgi:hypothetical protein